MDQNLPLHGCTQEPATHARASFLDLPPELRFEVYDYFFPRATYTMYLKYFRHERLPGLTENPSSRHPIPNSTETTDEESDREEDSDDEEEEAVEEESKPTEEPYEPGKFVRSPDQVTLQLLCKSIRAEVLGRIGVNVSFEMVAGAPRAPILDCEKVDCLGAWGMMQSFRFVVRFTGYGWDCNVIHRLDIVVAGINGAPRLRKLEVVFEAPNPVDVNDLEEVMGRVSALERSHGITATALVKRSEWAQASIIRPSLSQGQARDPPHPLRPARSDPGAHLLRPSRHRSSNPP